jgi:FlaA1/EpsC-like NDP-sugar epimerase
MVTGASAVSALLIYVLNFGLLPLLGIPYMRSGSIWLLQSVLSFLFLGGSRFILRMVQERYRPQELLRLRAFIQNPNRVLIVGAGDSGAMIVREILANPTLGYRLVGIVDDDLAKYRYKLYGVPVLGDRSAIPEIVKDYQVDQIIIAIPTASGKDIRDIVRICEAAGIHPRTIPGLYSLLDGRVSLSQVRNVDIEDLLRRDPVHTNTTAVRDLLHGRRVLITGGGGSIGSELCRQILRCRPSDLILVGHGENSVFEIQNELLRETAKLGLSDKCAIHAVVADIRFGDRIERIFRHYRPEIVFHAAAHKHVPLMEDNPAEAITNNVTGTRHILKAALAANVDRFVMISTDKAVNPTSVMGASKRAAELLVLEAANQTGKPFVAVRFGNVLGSRGSVVLTFKQQIAAGGPITVTDPNMKRFFMTIPEAVQLVLQASVLGKGGEVFLLDMGEPVKIVDLARDLIELSGLEVGRDIDIVYSGLRPGEKLFEELFVKGELYERTEHDKIFIAANASRIVPDGLDAFVTALEEAAGANDRGAILRNLQNLIPEYTPPQLEKSIEVPPDVPPAAQRELSAVPN